MTAPSSHPRVFITSTIRDLGDLRSALKFWLEELGLVVLESEYADFERAPDAGTFESCFDAIRTCHYYVLVLGEWRGSWYDEARRVSVTQQEFRVAAQLAQEGKIKPIIFIRASVMIALDERGAVEQAFAADPARVAEVRQLPSAHLQDPEHARAFLTEIRATQFQRLGPDGPAGGLWYYLFTTFRDLVDALRVALTIQRSVMRQALLATLKWEIEANLAELLTNRRTDMPFMGHSYMSSFRMSTRLQSGDADRIFPLNRWEIEQVAGFFLFVVPNIRRVRMAALDAAIHTGEFLLFDQGRARLVNSGVQEAMYDLRSAVEWCERLASALTRRQADWQKLVNARDAGARRFEIPGHAVASIFGLYDGVQNVVRLSVALLRYIVDPTAELRLPRLNPHSPFEDVAERLAAEQATHDDIEEWIKDGFIWTLMSDQIEESTEEDIEAAYRRFAGFREMLEPSIERGTQRLMERTDEIVRVLNEEGMEAANELLARIMRELREEEDRESDIDDLP